MQLLGALVVVILVILVGVLSGSKVRKAEEFTVAGRRLGASGVAGVVVGALVGGASTVGTAQAAYVYGLGGWWFTLGAGMACLALGLVLARAYRNANLETLPQFLMQSYGKPMRPIIAVTNSLGMFLSVPTQIVSTIALLAVLSHWGILASAVASIVLVFLYTLGGTQSAGVAGSFKIVAYVGAQAVLAATALWLSGGYSGLAAKLPHHPFLELTGHGTAQAIASAVSVIIGLLASQYAVTAVVAARNYRLSVAGAILSAVAVSLFGVGGVLAGMYMRANYPNIRPVEAMPMFIHVALPPFLAGMLLGALLVVVVSCAAGLVVGCSILFVRDLYQAYFRPHAGDREILVFSRLVAVILAALAAWLGLSRANLLLVQWNFLALGLRGATCLVPLLAAIIFPNLVKPMSGKVAALCGATVTLSWFMLFPRVFDPVYAGVIASALSFTLVQAFAPQSVPVVSAASGGKNV
jgi:SSS family solute:Na+ symporter